MYEHVLGSFIAFFFFAKNAPVWAYHFLRISSLAFVPYIQTSVHDGPYKYDTFLWQVTGPEITNIKRKWGGEGWRENFFHGLHYEKPISSMFPFVIVVPYGR